MQEGQDCVLGASIVIDGNVTFSGALQVDGIVRGDIQSTGAETASLTVSETGQVIGEIRVPRVVVSGSVSGSIHAVDRVELRPQARIAGDIRYGTIEIQLGAVIAGRLIHDDVDGSGKIVSLKPVSGHADSN